MLSICVTCKNRSKMNYGAHEVTPFPNLVKSLVNIYDKLDDEIELVVSDWNSNDWPLKLWLPKMIEDKFKYNIVDATGTFNRGAGRNIAVNNSKGDKVFFVDADMEFRSNIIINDAIRELNNNKVFFPICWSYTDHLHTKGDWTGGFGNFAATKEQMKLIGPWWEKGTWGYEDDDMYEKAGKFFTIVRDKYSDFIHQWHVVQIADGKIL